MTQTQRARIATVTVDADNDAARCEHPCMDGDTCTECGESCTLADVDSDDDWICRDLECPIHGSY